LATLPHEFKFKVGELAEVKRDFGGLARTNPEN
jgi:hypothetical protein